jgi:hypothetical protein
MWGSSRFLLLELEGTNNITPQQNEKLFVLHLVALCTTKTNGLQNYQNTITVPEYEIIRFMCRHSLASLKTDHFKNILMVDGSPYNAESHVGSTLTQVTKEGNFRLITHMVTADLNGKV